jgi:hypothetical protein
MAPTAISGERKGRNPASITHKQLKMRIVIGSLAVKSIAVMVN